MDLKNKKTRVGIYARISTQDQQTIPMQIRTMEEYAKKRRWIVKVKITEVASSIKHRRKRELLMEAARKKEIDAILVWKLDRWGRSVSDLVSSIKELQDLGVSFVSLTEALNFTTPAGRAMVSLLAVFAEFERDILRERVRAGLLQAKERGTVLGRPRTALAKKKKIEKLFQKNFSVSEIARRLGIHRRSVSRVLEA